MTLAVLATVALSACAPTAEPVAEPSGEAPTVEPAPTETAPAEPTEPFVIACDTIIPAERYDEIIAAGTPLYAPADFFAKLRAAPEPSPLVLFDDFGGTICPFSGGFEVVLAYGYSLLPADQVDAAVAALVADDYVASPADTGTLYTSATDGNAFKFVLVQDGRWFVASNVSVIDEMLAAVPAG
jgi:hypothetical protein